MGVAAGRSAQTIPSRSGRVGTGINLYRSLSVLCAKHGWLQSRTGVQWQVHSTCRECLMSFCVFRTRLPTVNRLPVSNCAPHCDVSLNASMAEYVSSEVSETSPGLRAQHCLVWFGLLLSVAGSTFLPACSTAHRSKAQQAAEERPACKLAAAVRSRLCQSVRLLLHPHG